MSSQASIKHKIGSRPSKGKLEITNERLIFTSNDKDNETFTIKKSDIDLINSQKTSWMYHEIRIISKDDKIYTIKKVPVSDAQKAVQWIQEAIKTSIEGKQDHEGSENRISISTKKELTAEETMQGGNVVLWTVTIVLVILGTSLGGFRSILTLAPCYAIRARETLATKDQKALDRIKNRKNHKVRLIISSVWGLIAVMLVIGALTEQASPTPTPQPVVEKQITPEEQAKIDADKKAEEEKIAEEKRQQEEYEKSPEYQAKIQKERIEKVIKQRKGEMYVYCQKSIKQLITFPETADFSYMDRNARAFGEGIVIKSYVEYKNAYNVPLKSNFRCEYKEVEGTWTLVDAKLE